MDEHPSIALPSSRLVIHSAPAITATRCAGSSRTAASPPTGSNSSQGSLGLDYLRRFHDLDLGLDPFPYNGGISTLDSLWMGVPVITLAGGTAVGRRG